MFSFCSPEVKRHPPAGSLFFSIRRADNIFAGAGTVDVGENDLPEGRRFWRTEWAERCSAAIRR